jgi:ribulose-5-phosphate 4-epimerase/fuculose-1-phosphate aldolase
MSRLKVVRSLRQPPDKGVVSRRRTGGLEKRGLSLVCSPAEWQLRVQLAAAYRIADFLGWNELIYTHISARVPGPQHHFLINPYGLAFDEVTASNLVKIDVDGNKVSDGPFSANKAGFVIHSAIHMARPDAACVWHMHTLAGMAVSAQEEGLLPAHMYAHNFWNRLSYHDFEGPSMRLDERERLVKSLGAHNQAIVLRNHGLLAIGRTIPEAFIRFWRLNRACEVQLAAQGSRLRIPAAEVCEQSFRMGEEFLADQADVGELEFAALLRKVQARDASYKN